MTAKIIRLPRGRSGGIFCPPLKLRFPIIYRVVQSATRKQLKAEGLADMMKPFRDCCYYTLTDASEHAAVFPGTIEATELRTLDPAIDRVSVVIHYHRSFDTAWAYHRGLWDYGADFRDFGLEPTCQTEEGIFTLITRPTNPSWPGPLIIYCVDRVPADNRFGENSWEAAVAPDGALIEPFDDLNGDG
jgi:hypothetical protein